MENLKHTKGEWIADTKAWINSKPQSISIQLTTENHFSGKTIASVNPICGDDFDRFNYDLEEAQANAKLIASAPDLLEALMIIINDDPTFLEIDKVRIAIDKATK